MKINDLFKKGNKLFVEKNLFGGLDVFKEIWLRFPKSKRLEEDSVKKKDEHHEYGHGKDGDH